MLKRDQSLKNSDTISYVLRKGFFVKSKFFNIKYIKTSSNSFKQVVIISKKKYKQAVERNQLRRRIKYILRKHNIHNLDIQTTIIPKRYLDNISFQEIESDIKLAFSAIPTT